MTRKNVNAAIREGMITDNPARRVEMPAGRWPQAVVWTEGRVEDWHADGVCPGVAVWAPSQLTEFLEFVAEDPLYPATPPVCAGTTSTSTSGSSPSPTSAPRSATRSSKAHPNRRPAAGPSRWTGAPSPCCGHTCAANAPST
jgi:hypothetical protein